MSVLTIRSHKRFAVRRPITLHETSGGKRGGLMIELSSEGCRISGLDSLAYTIDQQVTLELDGGERVPGRVRWAHDGFVGVKFANALRLTELGAMIEASRMAPERRYGT
ncbi:MAG: PilZ domain-containing protein [Porphyrobacter sp.]|nr:PilZ domain-containing protein [Porphyrobacter sp.]